MRKLILAAALMGAVACSSQGSTGPSATNIQVRVVDDRGDPVFRTQVTVKFDGQEPVSALTSRSGVATISVRETGEYVVRVVPRIGYDGSTGPITKSVTVSANSTSTVDFTIFRSGLAI